jgi:hypothetical protein
MQQANASTSGREALIEAARDYVGRGWSVIAVHDVTSGRCSCGADCGKSAGKHPAGGKGWQLAGLTTREQVDTMWSVYPDRNVGILTGRPSGFWVLDVDPVHGGDVELATLENMSGPIPPTRQTTTGSGGRHLHFAMPGDFEPTNSPGRLPPGLDVRGTGGMVVMPPSVSSVGAYSGANGWADWAAILAPGWLLDLVRPVVHVPSQRTPGGELPRVSGDRLVAYALAGARNELQRLRAAPDGRRGLTAYEVACNLIELINSPWAQLAEDVAHAAFDDAAAVAMDQGGKFDHHEADQAWKSARRKVGTRGRDAPVLPDESGGAPFDWSPPPNPSPATADNPPAAVAILAPSALHLPEAFWSARPSLAHIRQAAHARCCSADVVLMATLARLAAMVSPQAVLDVGAGPASLNLIVAPVGPSGTGKTQGTSLVRELIPLTGYLDGDAFRDGLPLGSGEGLAEAYMGTVTEKKPDLNDDGTTKIDKDGNLKTRSVKVRKKVRDHAFFVADEGEALLRTGERSGATILQMLRSAWSGALLGQANAREETTRIIPAGSYSFGLVVGFQTSTALPVLQDVNGLAQRVLWCSATDPSLSDELIAHPGPLYVDLSWHPMSVGGTPWTGTIDFPPAVKHELRRRRVARNNGTMTVDELDTHADLARAKVAALLCLLDNRRAVSDEDWALAGVIWGTSAAVRDRLIALGKEQAAVTAEEKVKAHTSRAVRTQAALDGYEDERVSRYARGLAVKIAEKGPMTHRAASHTLSGRVRERYYEDAVTYAVEWGWLIDDGEKLHAGQSHPRADQ